MSKGKTKTVRFAPETLLKEDYDHAYKLQLEEALTASLIDGGDSSYTTYDAVFGPNLANTLQADDLSNYEQELFDYYGFEAESKRIRVDLDRQIHDRAFACRIAKVPEAEWCRTGEYINNPFENGSNLKNFEFRVYVKGLVEQNWGGIGVAICDSSDGVVFEVSKGLNVNEHEGNNVLVEVKALIRGLDVATTLGMKKITIVSDNPLLYRCITGKNRPSQANVAALSDQMNLLLRKCTNFHASLTTSKKEMTFAYKLARKAVSFQANCSSTNTSTKSTASSTCTICLEDTNADQMFLIPDCLHSYCFSCMSKHVQFKLLEGMLPKCPFENCETELKLDGCKTFLTPELFETMSQRVKEASIPAGDKIYCPDPRCSTLLVKGHIQKSRGKLESAVCLKCRGVFCDSCKVPWHSGMTCYTYKRSNLDPCTEENKLKSLATKNLWRQCPKCNHMVSLSGGCNHISCRCGHGFCYTCGAEWEHKRQTCTCPIWDERNIIQDDQNRRKRRRGDYNL